LRVGFDAHLFHLVTTTVRPDVPIGADTLGRIREALAGRGLELWHAGWVPGARKGRLTLTIDREAGVTLDDCETASRLAEAILDEGEEIPGAFLLEVESPGLDRPLWTLDHCRRFAGRRVQVASNVSVDGAKRMKGPLEAVEGDALIVMDEDRKRRYTVRFGDVKVVRLIPEF
jgi:ribosome maturation factor RimP